MASVTFADPADKEGFRRLSALYELLSALTHAKNLPKVYDAATNSLIKATDADRAAILLFDSKGVMRFEAWNGLSQGYRDALTGHSPWQLGAMDAHPIVIPDVLEDENLRGLQNLFLREKIRALAFIPLEGEHGVFGKIMLYYAEPHTCRDSELAIAKVIASHVALVVERRRLEAASLYAAAIVENSEDAIVSKDLSGTITSWNKGAERIFGYTASEIVGKPVATLAAPDVINEMPAILDKIQRGERVDQYETRRRTKSGQIIDVSLTVSPVRDSSGCIIGASKIARDITERKRLESERALLLAREQQAQKELKRSNEDLRRANRDLEAFAYSTSHDLQEPLRTVIITAQLLNKRYKDKLPPEAAHLLSTVVSGAQRMETLVRDVLTYATAAKQVDGAPTAVDANAVLESVRNSLAALIDSSGAIITSGDLPVVSIHENRLAQLFQNLIGNALKYRSAQPPRIHIAVVERDGWWVFSISDNGAGIDRKFAGQIFELFKRLHTHGEVPGSGIGLAVCQRIVEQYGGRIWLERSAPGEGSTFCFTLPVNPA